MKKIKFIAMNESIYDIYEKPEPAGKNLPDWYRKQEKYAFGQKRIISGNINHTVKGCMPVFDIISGGYLIKSPADINFELNDGSYDTSWSTDLMKLIEHHNPIQYDSFSIPDGFYPVGLKFINPWIIQTPPGYSCLFISPAYRDDLPFYTLPAIVDTDKHPIPVNFPFFIKEGFEGILKQGTPIIQVIPFKRDEWESEFGFDMGDSFIKWQKAKRKISNNYKTFFRSSKVWK